MSDAHAAHDAGHHEHPAVPYFGIFATLVVFTIITIAASFWDLHSKAANVSLAFAIAGFKASLVMLFFMHLKYEKRPIVVIALIPFVLVAVLVLALIPDVFNGTFRQDSDPAVVKAANDK